MPAGVVDEPPVRFRTLFTQLLSSYPPLLRLVGQCTDLAQLARG